jgi:hypothetical protein
MPETQDPISVKEFAARIKAKYPDYKDIDDNELAKRMVEKYPEYKSQVIFDVVKKKEPSESPSQPSTSQSNIGGRNDYSSATSAFNEGMANINQQTQSVRPVRIGDTLPKPASESKQRGDIGSLPGAIVAPTSDTEVERQLKDLGKRRDKAIDKAVIQQNKKFGVTDKPDMTFNRKQIEDAYKEGDLVLDKDRDGEPVLKRGTGLLGSLKVALDDAHDREVENEYVVGLNKPDAIEYLNRRRKYPELVQEKTTAPQGLSGKIGEFVGENLGILAKGTAGAVGGAALAPTTGGGSFGVFLNTVKDAAYGGYAGALETNFNRIKDANPNLSDDEVYEKAHKAALVGELVGIGTAAILSKSFGTPKPSISTAPVAKSLEHTIRSSPKPILSSAAGSVINDITSIASGGKVSGEEIASNAKEAAKQMAIMHYGLWAMTEPFKIPSYQRPQIENLVASAPREQVKEFYNGMEETGAVPEGTTDKVISKLNKFDQQKKTVEDMPLSEEQKASITGKLLQRQKLEEETKRFKSFGGSFKSRIEANEKALETLDSEIDGIIKTGDVARYEQDTLTGERIADSKPHEELKKPEKEGIVVPKEYGVAEVVEVGEGENKTFKPKASFIVKEGGLEISKPIKFTEEKTYTDKDKAQAAADEALGKHYYENAMPETDKPITNEKSEVLQSPKVESVAVEEPNTNIQPSKEAKQQETNDLIDRVQAFQKMRKNEAGRSQELNEIRNKATELGLEYKDDYGKLFNSNGSEIQKRELVTNKTIFEGYDENNYSPETNVTVANLSAHDDAIAGLPILGTDGKRLSAKQRADALKSIREGKPTHAGKAIIDFIDKAVTEGGIEIEDVTSGKRVKVPLKEYMEVFKEPIREMTDAEFDEINELIGKDYFENELNNLIKQIENETNTNRQNQASNTGAAEPSTKGTTGKINAAEVGTETQETIGGKPPTEPPVTEIPTKDKPEFGNKAILKRLVESENIKPEIRERFKDNLKYKVKSHEEARTVAKELIREYDIEEAVELAEAGKFHGDVNSMIFGEALDQLYRLEQQAKTPQEKVEIATKWADVAIRYDEAARSGGRFISAIGDFYKKSPLGIKLKEEANRNAAFKEWFKPKEGSYKEVFEAIKEEPEFKEMVSKEVTEQLKKERTEARQKKRKNIEDFFDKAKFKGDATYATIIPPKVINGGIEAMKQAFLAGESVVNAVETAIEHISKEIKDWDKEKFRKEWEDKLRGMEPNKGKLSPEELSQQKKDRLLDRFRKKLKGLSDKEKEEVIRKSFKKLVESGALEYEDFKKIIADTIGLGEITEADKVKIDRYVKDINDVQDLAEKARTVRTEAALRQFREGAKRAEKSATALGEIVYNKPSIINRLTSIMQLNTLGIPSLINNPVFNIFNQAFVRFPKAVGLTAVDYAAKGIGKLLGKDVKVNNDVIAAQMPFFKGVKEGGMQSVEQMFTGLTNKDYFQKEVYTSQIRPFTSLKDIWSFAKGKKHLSGKQLLDKGLQGTIGIPAEVVARSLNIGDKPQRFATEKATAKTIANQYGLKGMDEKLFMEFPKQEAYRLEKAKGLSDEAAMKRAEEIETRIIREGEESTFQQENFVNSAITALGQAYDKMSEGNAPMESVGKLGKLFRTMNLPFVKIPMNAFWSYFNLVNPEVAFMQSAAFGSTAAYKKAKGMDGWQHDLEQSKKWLAHGATGMGILALTSTLTANGIVSGDNNSKDPKKEREGEKFYEQQHSLDMGKLNAWLQGKDPSEVTDGLKVDLKWWGVLGNAANLQANKYEKMTPEQRAEGISLMNEVLGENLVPSALEVFETGVFSNASSLANAFDRGGVYADAYLTNLINMGANTVHPAMFSQVSRATLPYDYTTKADTFLEQIKNNMSARSDLGRAIFNRYPPSKIGIWGDELKRNDDWAKRWFSMSRTNPDQFARPIYEDYKKTGDTGFFPPAVQPKLNGEKLNTAETRKLEILVGQSRKELVAPYVNNMAELPGYGRYKDLTDKQKVKALEILYKQGYDNAVDKFEAIYPKYKKPEKSWEQEDKETEEQDKAAELRGSIKQ